MGNNTDRPPSMAEVARIAGVSKTTVSRVLNNAPLVSMETKEKVLKACEEMGYRINTGIQDLIRTTLNRPSKNIAFVLVGAEFGDPGYARYVDGIAKGTIEGNYHLVLVKLTGKEQRIFDLPPVLRDHRVDGILTASTVGEEMLDLFHSMEVPCVILGNYYGNMPEGVLSVEVDLQAGFREIVSLLKKSGRQTVAFFNEVPESRHVGIFMSLFRQAMHEQRLALNEELVYSGRGAFTGAMSLLREVFRQEHLPFDAICCMDFRTSSEISHLIMWRYGMYKKNDVTLVTERPYSYHKLPAPDVIYIDYNMEESAYDGVTLLLSEFVQKEGFKFKKVIVNPTIEYPKPDIEW